MNKTEIDNYKKALVEVDIVLNCLENKEYRKIPRNIIETINENKNKEYFFEYDENLDYKEWNLMPEAKAVLYNIFKMYLATDDEKEYIAMKENFEKAQIEKQKVKKYNSNDIFKNKKNNASIITQKEDNDSLNNKLIEYKEPTLKKIINKVKSVFHIK